MASRKISVSAETVAQSISRLNNASRDIAAIDLPKNGVQPDIQGIAVWPTQGFHDAFAQTLQYLGEVADGYSAKMIETAENIKTVTTSMGQVNESISQRLNTMAAEAASLNVDALMNGPVTSDSGQSTSASVGGPSEAKDRGAF